MEYPELMQLITHYGDARVKAALAVNSEYQAKNDEVTRIRNEIEEILLDEKAKLIIRESE